MVDPFVSESLSIFPDWPCYSQPKHLLSNWNEVHKVKQCFFREWTYKWFTFTHTYVISFFVCFFFSHSFYAGSPLWSFVSNGITVLMFLFQLIFLFLCLWVGFCIIAFPYGRKLPNSDRGISRISNKYQWSSLKFVVDIQWIYLSNTNCQFTELDFITLWADIQFTGWIYGECELRSHIG